MSSINKNSLSSIGVVIGLIILICVVFLVVSAYRNSPSEPTLSLTSASTLASTLTLTNTATHTPTMSQTSTPTETSTPIPVLIATNTFTPTLTHTATSTSTPLPTDTNTPTATNTPIVTQTPTDTSTPTATYSPTPTLAWVPTPLLPPRLLSPLNEGSNSYTSPITFSWEGANVEYKVTLTHLGNEQLSAFTCDDSSWCDSGWIQAFTWTTELPKQRFGFWKWQVEMRNNESSSGNFWFNTQSDNKERDDGSIPSMDTPTPSPTATEPAICKYRPEQCEDS